MPNGHPSDGFFYPTLTLMIDPISLVFVLAAAKGECPAHSPHEKFVIVFCVFIMCVSVVFFVCFFLCPVSGHTRACGQV